MDDDFLHRQLVKLGDMMADGLHHESDGKWIEREYRETCYALGLIERPKRKRKRKVNSEQVNEAMAERVKAFKCKCGGEVKQTRSGSMRAQCVECDKKYQLLETRRK